MVDVPRPAVLVDADWSFLEGTWGTFLVLAVLAAVVAGLVAVFSIWGATVPVVVTLVAAGGGALIGLAYFTSVDPLALLVLVGIPGFILLLFVIELVG